jgi:hypothetical protein
VYQGNLILKTQADVDAIGTQGYNVINGSLSIGDRFTDATTPPVPSDITDLSPLITLTQVTRQIEIQNNPMLTSLDGLSNLAVVAGLVINNNENLTSLEGMDNLSSISGSVIFSGQNILNGGLISIFNNPALTSVETLSSINPQTLFLIDINGTGLTSLNGLENIAEVSRLNIVNNDNLTSLEALSGLTAVDDTVFISGNETLANYCILQQPLQDNPLLSVYNVIDNQFNSIQHNKILLTGIVVNKKQKPFR